MADDWRDGWCRAPDGTRLHYRDYGAPSDAPPVLCVPGLTRNARDFAKLAARLSARRRVIAVDLRGRGMSEPSPDPLRYVPPVYVEDLLALADALALDRLVWFGTSLGGLVGMLAALARRPLLAGILLNDVGPVLDPAGLARIGGYVGQGGRWPSWEAAADAIARTHGAAFPGYGAADWRAWAERTCRIDAEGRVTLDYDVRIAEPFRQPPPAQPVDLWPALEVLAGMPALLVRGARSDLLTEATAAEMARRLPELEVVTIPDVGHAPTLDEPEAAAAIDRLLERVDHR